SKAENVQIEVDTWQLRGPEKEKPYFGSVGCRKNPAERSRTACAKRSQNTMSEKQKGINENYRPAVTLSTKKLNNKLYVSVEDNGNGIPETIKEKIFQPFFTTKPTGQETGLGLSLSYDIIKAHGGEIRVKSLPTVEAGDEVHPDNLVGQDPGTAFIIILPL
ncbi:sensor histidine kinase, partial [Aquiflexum sp.]|uniref:sensor histidine kinase n=1 Tax=Aquiflexum sp. TaxID=1872584 RepID=UPI0035931B51